MATQKGKGGWGEKMLAYMRGVYVQRMNLYENERMCVYLRAGVCKCARARPRAWVVQGWGGGESDVERKRERGVLKSK